MGDNSQVSKSLKGIIDLSDILTAFEKNVYLKSDGNNESFNLFSSIYNHTNRYQVGFMAYLCILYVLAYFNQFLCTFIFSLGLIVFAIYLLNIDTTTYPTEGENGIQGIYQILSDKFNPDFPDSFIKIIGLVKEDFENNYFKKTFKTPEMSANNWGSLITAIIPLIASYPKKEHLLNIVTSQWFLIFYLIVTYISVFYIIYSLSNFKKRKDKLFLKKLTQLEFNLKLYSYSSKKFLYIQETTTTIESNDV